MTWVAGLLCDELAGDGVVAGSLLTPGPCFPEDSWDVAMTGVAGALSEELAVGKVPAGNTLTRITFTEDFWALARTRVSGALTDELAVDRGTAGSVPTPVTLTEDCREPAETPLARVLCGALAADTVAAGTGLPPFTSTGDCWEGLSGLGAGAGDGDFRKLLASHGIQLLPDRLFPERQGSLMRRGGRPTPSPWTGDRTKAMSGSSGFLPGGSPLRPPEPCDPVTVQLACCGTAKSAPVSIPRAAVLDSGGTLTERSSVQGCGGHICPSGPSSFQGLLAPEKGGLFRGGDCRKVSSEL